MDDQIRYQYYRHAQLGGVASLISLDYLVRTRLSLIFPLSLFLFSSLQTEICSSALTDVIHAVINGTDGCLFCFGHAGLGECSRLCNEMQHLEWDKKRVKHFSSSYHQGTTTSPPTSALFLLRSLFRQSSTSSWTNRHCPSLILAEHGQTIIIKYYIPFFSFEPS